jgi:D-beta-D-heptose 7-phosphate kinase/D-beta-D-heptose 1-phosphate adenosyltransferase
MISVEKEERKRYTCFFGGVMNTLNEEKVKSIKILVIGDVMLDKHLWGEVERISPEAPVPVVDVLRESAVPGGASNVAHNIVSLGAGASLCGVTGDDEDGRILNSLLNELKIDLSGVVKDAGRPTTVKTRVIAHNQQIVRIDKEKRDPLPLSVAGRLWEKIEAMKGRVDAVIIEDYGKGVITSELIKKTIQLFDGIPVAVDPKESHYDMYKGATVMTPNHHEAGRMFGHRIEDRRDLFFVGDGIMKDLDLQALMITLGKDGMSLFLKNGDVYLIPTVAREEYDVTGAGDTVIAVLSTMLGAGYDFPKAAAISNVAAGIVVEKPGVVPVYISELGERLKDDGISVQKVRG